MDDRDRIELAAFLRDLTQSLTPVSDTARLDAELLVADAMRVSRSDLLLGRAGPLDQAAHELLSATVPRRMAHEPMAYILEQQEFFGLDFAVSPAVLIPRADSETIVRAALDHGPAARRVLDCGTGSGALLLTYLDKVKSAKGVGVDASDEALNVAQYNAKRLGLAERAEMVLADWTQDGWADALGGFDLILANPPYVEVDAQLDPGVANWEPADALFAGKEGLDDYRILIPQLPLLLSQNGFAVLEIGASQREAVSSICENAGFSALCENDLAGRPRALVLRKA